MAQGHVQGALPPATYGQSGPLTLSQTYYVPPDQTPYTPSSFSGLDSVPSPPVPIQPPPSPGQNLSSSGQARALTPLSGPHPLQSPSLPPLPRPKVPLPEAATGAPPSAPQQRQRSPDQASSWGDSGGAGTASTALVPPGFDPPGFLGRHGSDSAAFLAEQRSSRHVLPTAAGIEKAPQGPPYLTRPGQITFEYSSAVPALAPAAPHLAPTGHPQGDYAPVAGQPVAGIRTADGTEGAPSSVLLPTGSPFLASSTPSGQKHPDSALLEAGNALHGFLTTQDIVISGAPQAPAQTEPIDSLILMHSFA